MLFSLRSFDLFCKFPPVHRRHLEHFFFFFFFADLSKESEKQDSATKGTNSTPTKSRAQQAMPRIRSFSKIMDDEGRALWAQQFGAEVLRPCRD